MRYLAIVISTLVVVALSESDEEKIEVPNIGGLHDYIFLTDRETLIKWALAAENYERQQKNENTVGGIHDYIRALKDEDIALYILDQVRKFPELGSRQKLDSLVQHGGCQATFGGLHDYLFEADRQTLIDWALACEKHHRAVSGQGGLILGGLEDYVYELAREQILEYILKEVNEHPELNNIEKIKELAKDGLMKPKLLGPFGAIENAVPLPDRDTLISWVLAIEHYHDQVLNIPRHFGGMHDKIRTMNKTQLMDYVLNEVDDHPELKSVDLDELARKYGFAKKEPRATNLGGIHDYIHLKDRETLISWVLTIEHYHDIVMKVPKHYGGMHDMIRAMNKTQLIDYILREVAEHTELNSANLDELAKEYGFAKSEPRTTNLGGIHDYIHLKDRETLMGWVLAIEEYHEKVMKVPRHYGGMHDMIRGMSKEQLMEYILKEAEEHTELNSMNLDEMAEKYGYFTRPVPLLTFGGTPDYIPIPDKDKLISWVLAIEQYHDQVMKVPRHFGGMHDMIRTMNRTQLMDYVLKEVEEHPELKSINLDDLAQEYGLIKRKGTIHDDDGYDYIRRQDKDTLVSWVFSIETYHNNVMHVKPHFGGMHDYVWKLTKEQLIEYIIREVQEHPELNSKDLNNLAKTSGYYVSPPAACPMGGLHDVIRIQSKEVLMKWVLAIEAYHDKVLKVQPHLGGLHDYIRNWEKNQLIDYIMKEVTEHPELNTISLEELARGILPEEPKPKTTPKVGGLDDYIWRFSDEKLRVWALTCEKYHREVNNTGNLIGGLHDYLMTMTKQELIDYIMREVDEHNELNSGEKLDNLAKTFGYTE